MKERGIPFSGPMVRAILEGRKSQTRRIVKEPKRFSHDFHMRDPMDGKASDPPWPHQLGADGRYHKLACPHGSPGDRLWVREAWRVSDCHDWRNGAQLANWNQGNRRNSVHWEADGSAPKWTGRYRHARFMPRWASRMTLEVVSVRVERLQEISEADAMAEGCQSGIDWSMWHIVAENASYHRGGAEPKIGEDEGLGGKIQFYKWEVIKGEPVLDRFRSLWWQINGAESWALNPWVWVIEFKRIETGVAHG